MLATTIPCNKENCPGCLNGEIKGIFEGPVYVFACNECGQEAGRASAEHVTRLQVNSDHWIGQHSKELNARLALVEVVKALKEGE